MTKTARFIKALEEAGQAGVSKDAFKKMLKTSDCGVYSIVHALRKKGMNIRSVDSVYFAGWQLNAPQDTPAQEQSSEQLPVVSRRSNMNKNITLPVAANNGRVQRREITNLSPDDRDDFFDMMKKSVFYRLSAEAVLEANRITEDIKKEVFLEG